ncbi:MAG: hypothetical protein OEZ58_18580 [Gammaproteobacteria bacterium]|nr:hypothetical protein [Gammaproteobacteria bacterium]MDH5730998.1 hypothetical protein [Gammaproteobacteria bacterium]
MWKNGVFSLLVLVAPLVGFAEMKIEVFSIPNMYVLENHESMKPNYEVVDSVLVSGNGEARLYFSVENSKLDDMYRYTNFQW